MDEVKATVTAEEVRSVIHAFIQERLQLKLDKLKDDQFDERERLRDVYGDEAWLSDAARRVLQIQQVTHAAKFTHPDARGSNVYNHGNQSAGTLLVGTHVLGEQLIPDVAGNSAALDVYKFLRLEVNDQTLLAMALESSQVLRDALSTDAAKAEQLIEAFASLTEAKKSPASHTLAKQLYWPLGSGQYHLIAPLFPSSLVSAVWTMQREHRFSDAAKAARDARKSRAPYPHGYHEYPNVVVQNFGGTKPQNISQLNSERYGENYLLPSLPPNWVSSEISWPAFTESVFSKGFASRRPVKEAVTDLRDYLERVKGVSNKSIRDERARRVQIVVDELLQYSGELWSLDAGWSMSTDCHLNTDEQCWLDPDRALIDSEFAARYQQGDWQDAICRRFANWFNARLSSGSRDLRVGEDEAFEWRRLLDREMILLHKELRHD